MRAAARITPTINVTAMGGVNVASYVSAAYAGTPSAANLSALSATSWSEANFQNFEMIKTYDGTTQVVLQWFPNDDEIRVEPPSNVLSNEYSGFYGYIQAPANNPVTYHIELDYGIEYTPSLAYRPFVERKPPTTHPDAYYYLNLFVGKNWDKCVVCTVEQYDAFVSMIEHVPLTLSTSFNQSNRIANPNNLPSLQKMTNQAYIEEEGYCEMIADTVGFDVCKPVSNAFRKTANTAGEILLGAIVGGQRPNALRN